MTDLFYFKRILLLSVDTLYIKTLQDTLHKVANLYVTRDMIEGATDESPSNLYKNYCFSLFCTKKNLLSFISHTKKNKNHSFHRDMNHDLQKIDQYPYDVTTAV